jgi:H+-transporting ATPase
LLYFAAFSILSARERRWFWSTMPSKSLIIALLADVVIGTALTYIGIPGLLPLQWNHVIIIFGFAMVACLGVNDTLKVVMIRWLLPAVAKR